MSVPLPKDIGNIGMIFMLQFSIPFGYLDVYKGAGGSKVKLLLSIASPSLFFVVASNPRIFYATTCFMTIIIVSK